MIATSAWVMMFAPREVGGAKWFRLEQVLAAPIDSASVIQLAEQTKRLLEAMGFECTTMLSKVALEVWELSDVSAELTKWKRRLKDTFGVRNVSGRPKSANADPRLIPLPETPKKMKIRPQMYTPPTKKDIFNATAESPYFVDSYMVTPKSSRGGRRDFIDDEEDAGAYFANQGDPLDDLTAHIRRSYEQRVLSIPQVVKKEDNM
ncbi:hypothetical protein PHYBOEH_000340 [Phytophthora boehmeriae]|uniref:Eukaryotic/viral aspartic protease n=1 Tax=Phytophthora boehmeriae TaxID=109152 RepID=A0A8T1VC41_9STRA|nr:hypothetical protein PHYBOEH_000340 [Phytophthora boehmeriae]